MRRPAPTVSRSFNVKKEPQTINFSALPALTYGVAPFAVTATASSGLTVTFASTTPSICTVSGTTVTVVGGQSSCTIQATQAGNNAYAAAPAVSRGSYVNRKAQTITFTTPPNQTYGAALTLSATTTSALAVSFCIHDYWSLHGFRHHGDHGFRRDLHHSGITGRQQRLSRSRDRISRSFSVAKASQTINFSALPALTYGETGVTLERNCTKLGPHGHVCIDYPIDLHRIGYDVDSGRRPE